VRGRITTLRVISCACCIGAALSIPLAGEPQAPPQSGTAATPAPQPAPAGRARGRAGLDQQIAAGADFLKRPPIVRLPPETQQKLFLLPDGYNIGLVLADPAIEDPVGVTFDGLRRSWACRFRLNCPRR
jgi:hypothetical protein